MNNDLGLEAQIYFRKRASLLGRLFTVNGVSPLIVARTAPSALAMPSFLMRGGYTPSCAQAKDASIEELKRLLAAAEQLPAAAIAASAAEHPVSYPVTFRPAAEGAAQGTAAGVDSVAFKTDLMRSPALPGVTVAAGIVAAAAACGSVYGFFRMQVRSEQRMVMDAAAGLAAAAALVALQYA